MNNYDRPLMVQSDRTMLLDVHSPSFDECRKDIIAFSSLIKSPEHIHTYSLTPLSIWNAISSGKTEKDIISALRKWSKYEIDDRVLFFISDTSSRYGLIEMKENDDKSYLLKVKNHSVAILLKKDKTLSPLLSSSDKEDCFTFDKLNRGTIKVLLIKLGYPVVDSIPLKQSDFVDIKLNESLSIRPYQNDALKAFVDGGSYGTVVLPCGSGKTIVGLMVMAKEKTKTLILCPNVTSVHQWIREITEKTNIKREDIGEYTGSEKEIKDITICTYQVLTYSIKSPDEKSDEKIYPHFNIFRENNWGLTIYDEVHMLPAPIFRITAEFQSIKRLGLTATLVREDHKEEEVFSLVGPKRIDIPWSELEKIGFIAKAYCHEIRVSLDKEEETEYALASRIDKFKIASQNKNKMAVVEELLEEHKEDKVIIIGQYLDQLQYLKKRFDYPLITGSTSNKTRDELYNKFRNGEIKTLIVSKVANYAIDLPDANVLIQVSGTFGSRQEEAQRLGRILRPKEKASHFYTIITEYSVEENAALNRQKFLSEQGYSYTIEKRG